ELHTAFVHACNACLSPLGLVKPPKDFSDLDYVMGTDGVQFRPILGGGEGLAADAPQGRAAAPGGAEGGAGRGAARPGAGGARGRGVGLLPVRRRRPVRLMRALAVAAPAVAVSSARTFRDCRC